MTFTTDRPAFEFRAGTAPLLVSFPHSGTYLPPCVTAVMTPEARQVPDTDWHLPRLYDFATALGASVLMATHSRYVIDVNRPADLPDTQRGSERITGACPMETFEGRRVYTAGYTPSAIDVAARREALWHPYHARLAAELERIRSAHGVAILWDAHSLRSHLPLYWEGKLPDINLGTHKGASCARPLAEALMQAVRQSEAFTSSINGRFTGGHITRHYGRPENGVHAFQCEIAQCTYMREEHPYEYQPDLAAGVQSQLRRMMEATLEFGRL